jgi:PLP dependent protein
MIDLPKDVKLVAAAKTRSVSQIKKAIRQGIRIIGENMIQEAESKYPELKGFFIENKVEFHFIGHLQRNKVKKAVQMFDMIQTLDSLDLADEIEKRAGETGKIQKVLVQVNIGREPQKSGIDPRNAKNIVSELMKYSHIETCGLMCIAPDLEDKEKTRPYFRQMKQLFDECKEALNASTGGLKGAHPILEKKVKKDSFTTLSMGMSDDYKIAIEEGSDMIRLGRAIFEEV